MKLVTREFKSHKRCHKTFNLYNPSCQRLCIYGYMFICACIYLFVYTCLSACPSVCAVSVCPYLSVCLSVCLSVYLSVCLFRSVYLSVYLRKKAVYSRRKRGHGAESSRRQQKQVSKLVK